jgi:RNA polymerase sigma-70 factor (ECF subfamily)
MSTGASESDLVAAVRRGEKQAIDRLFSLAYDELRHLAHLVRARSDSATLQTTALVHEAYFKLKPERPLSLEDRAHFTYVVARAMRQVLVDDARKRAAEKRGGDLLPVTLTDDVASDGLELHQLLALDEALETLGRFDPRKASIIECRFFGGLSVEETATALGVSTPTVKRDWRVARAWLAQALV